MNLPINAWLGKLGEGTFFIAAGAGILILALVLLAASMHALVVGFQRKPGLIRRQGVRPVGGLIRILGSLVVLFAALSLLLAGLVMRTYTAFTREDLIGVIECVDRKSVV
jgi:hypothetical protein